MPDVAISSTPVNQSSRRRGNIFSKAIESQPNCAKFHEKGGDFPARNLGRRKEHVLVRFRIEVTGTTLTFAVVVLVSEPKPAAFNLIRTDRF